MKNPFGKTVKIENAYFASSREGWDFRVLKLYNAPAVAADPVKGQYARAFTAVRSPMTFGSWEYGDSYVKDVPGLVDFLRGVAAKSAQPAEPRGPAEDEALEIERRDMIRKRPK